MGSLQSTPHTMQLLILLSAVTLTFAAPMPEGEESPAAVPYVHDATGDVAVPYVHEEIAAPAYNHEEIPAEEYVHQEIAAEPYSHVEIAAEPYVEPAAPCRVRRLPVRRLPHR